MNQSVQLIRDVLRSNPTGAKRTSIREQGEDDLEGALVEFQDDYKDEDGREVMKGDVGEIVAVTDQWYSVMTEVGQIKVPLAKADDLIFLLEPEEEVA